MKKLFLLSLLALASTVYASTPVTQTQVINVQPAASSDPSTYQSGACFLRSMYSLRNDAWRCVAGPQKNLYDPCFAVPGSNNLLVCGILPGIDNNGFTLKVSSLPNKPLMHNESSWAMQLADGTYCRVLNIAPLVPPMVADKKGNVIGKYGIYEVCSNNPAVTGSSPNDVTLAGSGIAEGSIKPGKVWTATRLFYTPSQDDSTRVLLTKAQKVQIAKVWQ